MPELLLELFSEEIPARMQARAAGELERAVNKALLDAGFMPEGVKAFSGPRRLTLVATGLPVRQPDRREEKKGPRVGAPEKAVQGFLKSAGLSSLDDCEQREDKKGAYYVAVIDQKGRETAELIAGFVPEIVRGFSWPKSMRWGDGDLRWVRPLHGVLCAFDGEVVPFEIEGVASGDKTKGHRFMAPGDIQARSYDVYAAKLREAKVILDAEERAEIIARDAVTLAQSQGFELVEDAGLLNEVAGLAEWPVAMMGSFDKNFLKLPDEVLTASMRGHQKYFSVRDPKTGRLANRFIYVANLEAPDGGAAMRTGYERVLTARLSDGWYLYNQDLKTPLEHRVHDLKKVKFFEGLGSVGDKARRVAALAKEIAPAVGADPDLAERAAMLAKADLVSGMVYEFPELQGVMGRYYHLAQSGFSSPIHGGGVEAAGRDGGGDGANTPSASLRSAAPPQAGEREAALQIAAAIRDHYKPAGQDDDVPSAPVSVAVALADKIDTLTAFWAIDKKPTGSSDPFALRRASLGVVRSIVENRLRLRLSHILFRSWRELAVSLAESGNLEFTHFVDGTVRNRFFEEKKIGYRTIQQFIGRFRAYRLILRYEVDRYKEEFKNANPSDLKTSNVDLTFADLSASDHPSSKFSESIPFFTRLNFLESFVPFIFDRLKIYLRDNGYKHDNIEAVLSDANGVPEDDLVLIAAKLKALEAFLKSDDGANLAAAYKRAANILKAEEKKDKSSADPDAVEEGALQEREEKDLFAALKDAEAKAEKATASEDFEAAMAALAQLRAPLDSFFEKVTVNADDAKLRANRLSLLARFRAATAKVADFSKLEG